MSQHFLLVLKSIYAINGIVGVSLYIPQIISAWKDKNKALSLSMITFGGWCISALITVMYALYFVHDKLMAGLSLANVVAAGALFLLILQTKLQAKKSGYRQSPAYVWNHD